VDVDNHKFDKLMSIESSNLEKPDNPPIVTMADNRTMAQLLEAPTEGYEDAIVIPEITANNFEIKHRLTRAYQQALACFPMSHPAKAETQGVNKNGYHHNTRCLYREH
ncbi:hypothetical protein Tco_0406567, partial [Tanacetum coccineum]